MKKIKILAFSLVLAFVLMGAGYAAWSENLSLSGTVKTGELDWYFSNWGQMDSGNDYICEPGCYDGFEEADKDVARTTVTGLDTDGDGDKDTVRVAVTNGYPGYYNSPYVTVKNNGTIPVKIQQPIVSAPSEVDVHWIDSVGTVLMPGQFTSVFYDLRVNESAQESSNYTFTIKIPGIQWNAG